MARLAKIALPAEANACLVFSLRLPRARRLRTPRTGFASFSANHGIHGYLLETKRPPAAKKPTAKETYCDDSERIGITAIVLLFSSTSTIPGLPLAVT
jgi:hypothetical protein